MTTWFVTGSSRGLGLELTRQIVDRGDTIAATARSASSLPEALRRREAVLAIPMDVTDPAAVQAAVEAAIARFGGIDIVLNNAGYGLTCAVEEASDAEVRAIFETNFFGTLNVIRAVLPHLRERRAGRILNVGSVSGLRGVAGVGIYSATKHALEGLTEALAHEVAPLGIEVCVAELGAVRTGFLAAGAMQFAGGRIADYTGGAVTFAAEFAATGDGHQLNDAVPVAEVIIDAATAVRLPVHLPIGPDALAAVSARARAFDEPIELWGERAGATAHPDGGGGAPAR